MHITHPLYYKTMRDDALRIRRKVGANIRKKRDRLHMPLQILAKKSGIEIGNLDHFELGKSEIDVAHIVRIANALGVTPEELLA